MRVIDLSLFSVPKIICVLRQDLLGPPRTQIGTIFADLATQTAPLWRPRQTWPWKTKLRFADAIASEDPGPSTSGAIRMCWHFLVRTVHFITLCFGQSSCDWSGYLLQASCQKSLVVLNSFVFLEPLAVRKTNEFQKSFLLGNEAIIGSRTDSLSRCWTNKGLSQRNRWQQIWALAHSSDSGKWRHKKKPS